MTDPRERLKAAVRDRYAIQQEIGQGGMATVFLAEDLKHHRKVAVKLLNEDLAHTIGLRRFLREIEVIAGLQHPHLLTLIDSGDAGGLPYYVMPFVVGQSLREQLTRDGRLPLDQAISIAREVADGLAYAHANGVIHRDIKPANILMSGGHAMVADFGIATALHKAAVGRLTETGISLGSPTYMSPEQAAGERDLDLRTDVYSLACVMYEMLCGEPPVDDPSMQQIVTRKLTGGFRPVREIRADVPAGIESAIHKALSIAREDRFDSIETFSQALAAPLREQARPSRRRMLAGVAIAVLFAVVLGFRYSRVLWATQQLGEINRLATGGEYASAFELAQRVRSVLPRDSALASITPTFTDYVRIVTVPTGARVYRRRLGRLADEWKLVGATPLDSVPMPKYGEDMTYLLRIEAGGYRTVEVLPNLFTLWAEWRNVRPLDTLRLDRDGDENAGMIWMPGWRIRDTLHRGGDSVRLADYHIGRTEVTNSEFKRFVDAGGYAKREYWTEPFKRDGKQVAWEEAMALMRDRSGVAGPSTWSGGTFPEGQGDYPVGGVSYHEAAAYARFAGARLPTSAHWARAALRHDRETAWIYKPVSNLAGTGPRPVGQGLGNAYGLFDVAGNVREWCVNELEGGRLTRGGGWEDAEFLVGHLIPKPEMDRSPSNGLRIMQVTDADTSLAHLSGPITRALPRDYSKFTAVSDAEYRIYSRLFDYDPQPLHERIDTSGVGEHYRWEKATFTAAYAGPRMAAYLFLPKDAKPPYQPIILWHGSGAAMARSLGEKFNGERVDDFFIGKLLGFVPRSGRALVLPLYMGTFERDDSAFSYSGTPSATTPRLRDIGIQQVQDLRRTMDYLRSRPDMDSDHAGFYGYSWGSEVAPLALSIEPRIRAAVLNTGGLRTGVASLPEMDEANYLPRVRTPVLMLNGRHDVVFPYETSQLPFFQRLGTAAADKKHVVFETSHTVPQEDNARETLAWFDKYLGPVRRQP